MSRVLRMPSVSELPPGAVRELVVFLFNIYREAHRPTLQAISDAVRDGDYRGTASRETVRKMLHGTSVPGWNTAESVFLALCMLADWNPEGRWTYDRTVTSGLEHMRRLWNAALDEPLDPWEPPF